MQKLSERDITWIVKQKVMNSRTNNEIAQYQKVTARRVKQLWKIFRETCRLPCLKKPGRPKKEITPEETSFILEHYNEFRVGAVMLEKIIETETGKRIPHNRIHKILRSNGLAKDEPSKKKRRKWVRFERDHSMTLLHTDWFELPDKHWLTVYLDDASRDVLGWGVFDRALTENSLIVLDAVIKERGLPEAILTDRGTQFYPNKKDKNGEADCRFQNYLSELGIKHIVARVNHPQTNGKLERFYGTVSNKLGEFGNIGELIHWYRFIRPHMSLDVDALETPSQAFYRKLPPERILGMFQEICPGW